MEFVETEIGQTPVDKIEVEVNDSANDFQKFIYELFDKNGILNDLRAYLRGHIVNVLKSAQTGDPPLCQNNFTKRLELASQALNILIAEYLLRLEFTYTLSVFVSEIPLSNMVFDFAKSLLKGTETSKMTFKENDVWSVLNYLGVQCDSEHALKIVEMYKHEGQTPLLHCIIKCMPMYRREGVNVQDENSSRDSFTSSGYSMDTHEEKKSKIHRNRSCHEKCRHYAFCKSCQSRVLRVKEKYRRKKEQFVKSTKKSTFNPLNVESFMKNINVMEKRIIEEMFEQLKSVYEAEVDMVRQEEENRVKRTLATHALQLQQRQEQLEESLKARQAELELTAQQKKQFLWGVARALRTQHEHVTRAMALIKKEQTILVEKENNLETQRLEAEESLRRKGEEMRVQISKELAILEKNFESMKQERDSLNRARFDFENLKTFCDSKTKIIEAGNKDTDDLKQHYEMVKEELVTLKKYIESTRVQPQNLVDKGTITDIVEVPSNTNILNNTQCLERSSRTDNSDRDVRPPNQVLNDLKKPKNVNFSQSNLDEVYRELSRERSRSSLSSEGCNERESRHDCDVIQRLIEENESLKDYARQQSEHISALWSERGRGSVPGVPRPCTAPSVLPAANFFTVHGVNPSTSANTFGWRKGAGEELSLFSNEQPRIVLPGEPLPFLGMVRDRHADNRRHLINQWRALKRSSPLAGVSKVRPSVPIQRDMGQRPIAGSTRTNISGLPVLSVVEDPNKNLFGTVELRQNTQDDEQSRASSITPQKSREKSPKTVLKEAKEKLRNKNDIRKKLPLQKREKSPNSMLREAKLRLRKLEIEAEAVEKSYLDFRKRQAELRDERKSLSQLQDGFFNDPIENYNVKRSARVDEKICPKVNVSIKDPNYSTKNDFDKYLREYSENFNIGEMHFKNRTTTIEKVQPIPAAYSEVNAKNDGKRKNVDYLATPIMEFRKLYHAEKERTKHQFKFKETDHFTTEVVEKCDKKNVIMKDETNLLNNENSNIELFKNPNNLYEETDKALNDIDNVCGKIVDDPNSMQKDEKCIYDFTDHDSKLSEKDERDPVNAIKEIKTFNQLETLRGIKNNTVAELEILKENINKIYNLKLSPRLNITSIDENPEDIGTDANILDTKNYINKDKQIENGDKNILRVEVESSCDVNKVKISESQEDAILIVVESSANTKESDGSEDAIGQQPPMTVIVSPKELNVGPKDTNIDINEQPKSVKSESPEQAAQLTRNDVLNAIFHADDNKDISSTDMQLELSNDIKDGGSDPEKEGFDDYPDDFSADVDNYNSRSEYGNNSPISVPKTSDDENFWDN